MARFSLKFISGTSLICSVLPRLLHYHSSIEQLVKLFFIIFFTQIIAWIFWFSLIYPHFFSPLRYLPQPKGAHWLLGHGVESVRCGPGILARKWINEVENDGLIRVLWHLNTEVVLITSPDALAEVLVTKGYIFQKPKFFRDSLASILGWSILTVEGDEHKKQRRNLMPAFSFRHIKDMYTVFWQKSCEVTAAMTAACEGQQVTDMEISSWASRCTLDIMGVAGIGRDFGAIRDKNNPLVKRYKGFATSAEDILLIGLRALLPEQIVSNLPIKKVRTIVQASKAIRRVCADLIDEKKQKLADDEATGVDILSVALSNGMFSDASLADQLLTFLTAGQDTTATSLTWAIYMLSRFPTIQDRLRDEVRRKLPCIKTGRQIASSDIDSMSYLNAVCSEVLRICPPVPQTLRICDHDTTIQGQLIPGGTLILLAPWATKVDVKLWGPDALGFKPERWLSGEQGGSNSSQRTAAGGATSNYAFMTFLHGPRSCIGASFAKAEFACLLAAWIGRFSFELTDKALMDEGNINVDPSVVAKPVGGLHTLVEVVDGF